MNKIPELLLIESQITPIVICLTETWLQKDTPNSFLLLPAYSIYRHDRDTRGGGVLIAVNNKFISNEIGNMPSDNEIVGVDIMITQIMKLRVICAYRPPNTSDDNVESFFSQIERLIKIDSPFILVGDFIFPDVSWTTSTFPDNKKYTVFQKFYFRNQPMEQLIHFPTRSTHILDLAFTNTINLFQTPESLPNLGNSDHSTVKVSMTIKLLHKKTSNQYRNFYKGDYNSLLMELKRRDFGLIGNPNRSALEIWNFFQNSINDLIMKYIPFSKTKRNSKAPWITQQLHKLYTKCRRLKRKLDHKKTERVSSKYKEAKRTFSKELKSAKEKYEDAIISNKNRKQLFTYISKQIRNTSKFIPNLKYQNDFVTDDGKRATIFNSFFASIFLQKRDLPTSGKPQTSVYFTEDMFHSSINSLNKSSSPGPDRIPMFFWYKIKEEIASEITTIFNLFLLDNKIPEEWKISYIFPLYKEVDHRTKFHLIDLLILPVPFRSYSKKCY